MASILCADTIVLRVSIFSKETNNLVSNLYILFHSGIKKYLIRGCNYAEAGKSCGNAGLESVSPSVECDEFSFGCRDKTSVCEFINILIADNYSVFYLLNYSRMYIDSKMITYAYLDYVSGVDTNRSLISSALHDEGRISHIFRYLAIIKDFANPY
jgi:hypothetical protein